ncbi:hypothetical protein ABT119_06075 [Streptomyces sp. NPDC001910]|uniref:hypothetical protein n=1 Tax=Streptomyces sp. NPDC001910 TaxID=3154403 RepID=UPI00331C4BEB
MSSGNQQLDLNTTYDWQITVSGPTGDGRTATQDHRGTYRARHAGQTAVDVLEELRVDCARRMGIPLNTAKAVHFSLKG